MAIERYGSKTDVVVKLVLVFFVCLLSFSIGTFVGKKFSDNQHKLAKFEPESGTAGHEETAAAGTTGEGEHKKALSDEEFAKLAEEFVADDEGTRAPANANEHGEKGHGAPAAKKEAHGSDDHGAAKKDDHAAAGAKKPAKDAHGAPAKDAHGAPVKKDDHAAVDAHGATAHGAKNERIAEPSKVAEKVARNQKVESKTEHGGSRIPAALPKEIGSSAIGKYTVQVGSYPSEDEAKKRTEALKEQTFSAFYVEAKVKDKVWYRVSLGLFNTQKEAEAYMKDLLERKKISSAIVQKISK